MQIADIYHLPVESEVSIKGWVKTIRHHGRIIFLDLVDSSNGIQIVIENMSDLSLRSEAFVTIEGILRSNNSRLEVHARRVEINAYFELNLSPLPHEDFNLFDPPSIDNLLANRHLYIRNPQLQAVMRFRQKFFQVIHRLLSDKGCIEIHAPVLTEAILYDECTAFKVDYFGHEVYLTQCVGFYLEAYIHAFDQVYNIGPSFRSEAVRDRRHLSEYWHVKAEFAHIDLFGLMLFVESFMNDLCSSLLCEAQPELDKLDSPLAQINFKPPYPQITYREALNRLSAEGMEVEFGRHLPAHAEDALSKQFNQPFWIVGLPAAVEPFPYCLDKDDPELTRTADLHAPNGFGELLGVAEKIHRYDELIERAMAKDVANVERIQWYFDLRKAACIPHGGFGMGVERTIRWLLHLPHVRDAVPFPRLFKRRPVP